MSDKGASFAKLIKLPDAINDLNLDGDPEQIVSLKLADPPVRPHGTHAISCVPGRPISRLCQPFKFLVKMCKFWKLMILIRISVVNPSKNRPVSVKKHRVVTSTGKHRVVITFSPPLYLDLSIHGRHRFRIVKFSTVFDRVGGGFIRFAF